MRILELQRRLREVGRIRIGEQVATGNGKTRPSKLEHFRLTSRDELVIRAAADTWGGTPRPWENAPDGPQWEVLTDTDQMQVVIPPGDMAFSQAYEQWSAGGCEVRCDGQRDVIADKPCHCDPEARACDIHTRLSVILPDLPGMGVWRLDTRGYYAAVELGGLVDLIGAYSERGVMLPARLRLEQRSVKRPKAGGGGVETRRFAVPVLDVDVHPLALTGGLNPATGELAGPVGIPALPTSNLTPVPPVEDGAGAPSIAEQMARIDQAQPKAARANAARPIPATGVKPRTARDAEDGAAAPQLPADVVERIRRQLNDLGADARRLFLAEFGCPPKELRLEQLDAAVKFVADMAPFDDGTDHPEVLSAPGDNGEGVAEPAPDPKPATPEPDDEPLPPAAGPTFGVKDVARYSTEVFKADYDAAPRGDKTKVVDRLRHALVWAQTGGAKTSLNDLSIEQLMQVNGRLRDIAEGRMVYALEADQVTFVVVGSDTEVTVTWADLEQTEAA